jgi:hypothetical protein
MQVGRHAYDWALSGLSNSDILIITWLVVEF